MKKSRSSTMCVAALAAAVVLSPATATLAQSDAASLEPGVFQPGTMEGSLTYPATAQHLLIGPYVQSVGPYVQGFHGVLEGIAGQAGLTGSFGHEGFPSIGLHYGSEYADWAAIREATRTTDGDWAQLPDAMDVAGWQ